MHPTFVLQPLVGALRTQAFLDLGGLCEAVRSGVQLLLGAYSGGVILEVNTTPGFHYHYHQNDGSYPVAARVLEQLFRDLRR